jgi:hypothetical protein
MRLLTVTKRVTTLEHTLALLRLSQENHCRSATGVHDSALPVLRQLQKLAEETERIKGESVASQDYRTALACVRELCRILELIAKLGGELNEKTQTNILNVNIGPETGKRIAETYLARLKDRRQSE